MSLLLLVNFIRLINSVSLFEAQGQADLGRSSQPHRAASTRGSHRNFLYGEVLLEALFGHDRE